MLLKQEAIANETKEFLNMYGLKAKYVAEKCDISPHTLSKFMCHRLALSLNQFNRLVSYMAEYRDRMR